MFSVKVYNDGVEVFDGALSQFLADNDNDEWLTEECKKLDDVNRIEFSEFSGDWVILNQVMGVNEAAKLWGLKPGYIKNLCSASKVIARKIDNRWIIDKNQPNPSQKTSA